MARLSKDNNIEKIVSVQLFLKTFSTKKKVNLIVTIAEMLRKDLTPGTEFSHWTKKITTEYWLT